MRIILTGASGFVGMGLARVLASRDCQVVGVSRTVPGYLPENCSHKRVDIQADTDWSRLLEGVETIVHMADGFNAFEHVGDPGPGVLQTGKTQDLGAAFGRMRATLHFAESALKHGVKHFIYLSSIKAMCGTWSANILDESSVAEPDSLYGRLKLEAEQALLDRAEGQEMIVTALRFPIVFGPKADGNFTRLLKLADSGWPLPLAGVKANRSMISQTSLIDAIAHVVDAGPMTSSTYLVHDEALNLPEILSHMRVGMKRGKNIFPVPNLLLEPLICLPKIGASALRVLRPLELKDDRFRAGFSWNPPVRMGEELQKIAANYKRSL